MKKYIENIAVRIVAAFLCTVSAISILLSVLLTVFFVEARNYSTVYEDGKYKLADDYALYALEQVKTGKQEDLTRFLQKTNIDCSITKIANSMGKDVSEEEKTSLIYTTTDEIQTWDYQIEAFDGVEYDYKIDSLLGALNYNNAYYLGNETTIPIDIDGYAYNKDTGIFYYKTEVGYFKVDYIYVTIDDLSYDYKLVEKDGKEYYYNSYYDLVLDTTKSNTWDYVTIADAYMEFSEDTIPHISNTVIAENIRSGTYFLDGNVIYYYDEDIVDKYIINIKVKESPQAPYFAQEDMYANWRNILDYIYEYEDDVTGILVSGVLLLIASFTLLVCATPTEREKLGFMHRIPVFIFTGGFVGLEAAGFVCVYEVTDAWSKGNIISPEDMMLTISLLLVGCMFFVAFLYLGNIIARLRARSFWRYSEFYYILKPFRAVWNYAKENMPLFWKGLLILVGLTIIEFIVVVMCWYEVDVLLGWLLVGKCIEIPLVLYVLLQMKKLQEGSKRIASGDLSQPIDTSKMIWEFKKHGENINKVSEGISIAVEEQLKSERFKTELITNVSHDIKTPLTSIINYVDLIKKEDLTNPTVCEYVDVLDRQSSRLKKLIEDLMEASKASTGNLAVHFEECDVEVLLTQVIGEFEDKLRANALEVVVDKPEKPVPVIADGRHLWRVLDNLLNNACKYSQPNTRVYVSLKQEGTIATITFKNISKTALNIPSDELMERFVRGDSSRNTEGSGLGLSIAQSLTELMNGTMKLDIDGDLFKVVLTFNAISEN